MKEVLRKAQKSKSPGIDKVANFLLNSFDSVYENMTNCFKRIITNPETSPQWFTKLITYVLPKSNETNIPNNYRLFTCLSTL